MIRRACAAIAFCSFFVATSVTAQVPSTDAAAPPEIPKAIRDRLPEPDRVEAVAPAPPTGQPPVPPVSLPVPAPSHPTAPAPSNSEEGQKRETAGAEEPVFLTRPGEPNKFPLEAS